VAKATASVVVVTTAFAAVVARRLKPATAANRIPGALFRRPPNTVM
jgi:hypothetical protein